MNLSARAHPTSLNDHKYSGFRQISIYPEAKALTSPNNEKPPRNITKGPYENPEHYLHTHFTLLREDFFKPIREDLCAFSKRPLENTIMHHIVFTRRGIYKGDICYCIKLKSNIKADDKRFMLGSLLLFSNNNFKTIVFGRVVNAGKLQHGLVLVNFEYPPNLLFGETYLMLECNNFFEPYYHVLKVIQGTQTKNLAMKNYLVYTKPLVYMPAYCNGVRANVHDYQLNQSQLTAINGALSRELAVIQGPPGTGKTFLALKIAEKLLAHSAQSPLLIISFTNHALDQFLEGLTKYTNNILRCGDRTKSAKMINYTIAERRKVFNNTVIGSIWKTKTPPLYKKYISIEKEINQIEDLVDCLTIGIFNIGRYIQIPFSSYTPNRLVCWLMEQGATEKDRQHDRAKMAKVYHNDIQDFCLTETDLADHCYNQLDPFKIPVNIRWQIYRSWLFKYKTTLIQQIDNLTPQYKLAYNNWINVQEPSNLALMSQHKVIGMTTTTSARMHSTIRALKCPIVIVEEAAQVLEAHIIPVLTEHCKHLILIGDHQQLRPSTADHDIETHGKLGISLFERMVNNNIPCYTLNVQHRMRPEISSLISPSIYPVLYDHDSVKRFPLVKGMGTNVYFINHSQTEKTSRETSKSNIYEAIFLIELAKYLIKKGYQSEEITILAAYLGQVDALTTEQRKNADEKLKKVHITSVDNFQGEENRIILLSLVRNNPQKKVGFLTIENRACVALSRAREGLYMMGNMDHLTMRSQLWKQINASLVRQNAVGTSLPLKCVHHNKIVRIHQPKDFDKKCPSKCLQDTVQSRVLNQTPVLNYQSIQYAEMPRNISYNFNENYRNGFKRYKPERPSR